LNIDDEALSFFCPICGNENVCDVEHKEIAGDNGNISVDIIRLSCCRQQTIRIYPDKGV
jgi:hypothetical protein